MYHLKTSSGKSNAKDQYWQEHSALNYLICIDMIDLYLCILCTIFLVKGFPLSDDRTSRFIVIIPLMHTDSVRPLPRFSSCPLIWDQWRPGFCSIIFNLCFGQIFRAAPLPVPHLLCYWVIYVIRLVLFNVAVSLVRRRERMLVLLRSFCCKHKGNERKRAFNSTILSSLEHTDKANSQEATMIDHVIGDCSLAIR